MKNYISKYFVPTWAAADDLAMALIEDVDKRYNRTFDFRVIESMSLLCVECGPRLFYIYVRP